MTDKLEHKLKYLRLNWLLNNFDNYMNQLKIKTISNYKCIMAIVEKEYELRVEAARLSRIVRAKIPEHLIMSTYPFNKQPRLNKKRILNIYDSLKFVTEYQNLIFIGPTGCGKTGLATAFLIQAINSGYRGLYITFSNLLRAFEKAKGDHTEQRIIKKFVSIDVLLIDEIGYDSCSKIQAAMFFEIMRSRHKRAATIITSQLGFDEWNKFLPEEHIIAALLDRLTENCTVFNMKDCVSLRGKKITHVIKK